MTPKVVERKDLRKPRWPWIWQFLTQMTHPPRSNESRPHLLLSEETLKYYFREYNCVFLRQKPSSHHHPFPLSQTLLPGKFHLWVSLRFHLWFWHRSRCSWDEPACALSQNLAWDEHQNVVGMKQTGVVTCYDLEMMHPLKNRFRCWKSGPQKWCYWQVIGSWDHYPHPWIDALVR